MNPKCELPGCGLDKKWFNRTEREDWGYRCPRNADAHALCAKVAKLEEQLAEADFCIAWRVDLSEGTDPRYMGRKANMRGMAAQGAAIEREEARKKGAEHESTPPSL